MTLVDWVLAIVRSIHVNADNWQRRSSVRKKTVGFCAAAWVYAVAAIAAVARAASSSEILRSSAAAACRANGPKWM